DLRGAPDGARRGGRGVVRGCPARGPEAGGLPRQGGQGRCRSARAVRGRAARPGAAGRDAPEDLRHRRLPGDPPHVSCAHHHGDGQGLGDRHGRRPRGRRRRLRGQALPPTGARGPHAGRAAPRAPQCRGHPVRRRGARGRRRAARPGPARGLRSGRADQPAAQGVRAARAAPLQRRPGAHPGDAHRPRLGAPLRRGHEDARRPREAAAVQGRGDARQPGPHRHHPRPGLQVRGRSAL
ncbi:MAG: Phosphate regulon transcriptional regulatory protein PhoB (SphR), partial [uncultured Acidimicrobiales bacterium]